MRHKVVCHQHKKKHIALHIPYVTQRTSCLTHYILFKFAHSFILEDLFQNSIPPPVIFVNLSSWAVSLLSMIKVILPWWPGGKMAQRIKIKSQSNHCHNCNVWIYMWANHVRKVWFLFWRGEEGRGASSVPLPGWLVAKPLKMCELTISMPPLSLPTPPPHTHTRITLSNTH